MEYQLSMESFITKTLKNKKLLLKLSLIPFLIIVFFLLNYFEVPILPNTFCSKFGFSGKVITPASVYFCPPECVTPKYEGCGALECFSGVPLPICKGW